MQLNLYKQCEIKAIGYWKIDITCSPWQDLNLQCCLTGLKLCNALTHYAIDLHWIRWVKLKPDSPTSIQTVYTVLHWKNPVYTTFRDNQSNAALIISVHCFYIQPITGIYQKPVYTDNFPCTLIIFNVHWLSMQHLIGYL